MEESKPTTPLMNRNPESTKLDEHIVHEKDATIYHSIIGNFLYVEINTRPDLCVAGSSLGAHMKIRDQTQLVAAKQELQYLKGTSDRSLMLKPGGVNQISAYVD